MLTLICVTFETMFTKFRDKFTNVTQSVSKQSNKLKMNSTITELEEEKVRIKNSSDDKISLEIKKIDEKRAL